MPKHAEVITLKHYGIYQSWDKVGRGLPKIKEVTEYIPAIVDIEFGLTINVKKAKGIKLDWCIDHPQITDKKGKTMQPFTGREFVKTNDWDFYLGDTIWAPIEDKAGPWHIYIEYNDKIVIEKTFEVSIEDELFHKQNQFWKRRGF